MPDGAYEVAIDTSINSDGITAFVAQVIGALEEIQSRASKAQDEGASQVGLSSGFQGIRRQAEKTIRSSGAPEADQQRAVDQLGKGFRNTAEQLTKVSRGFQDLAVISKSEQKRIRDQYNSPTGVQRQQRVVPVVEKATTRAPERAVPIIVEKVAPAQKPAPEKPAPKTGFLRGSANRVSGAVWGQDEKSPVARALRRPVGGWDERGSIGGGPPLPPEPEPPKPGAAPPKKSPEPAAPPEAPLRRSGERDANGRFTKKSPEPVVATPPPLDPKPAAVTPPPPPKPVVAVSPEPPKPPAPAPTPAPRREPELVVPIAPEPPKPVAATALPPKKPLEPVAALPPEPEPPNSAAAAPPLPPKKPPKATASPDDEEPPEPPKKKLKTIAELQGAQSEQPKQYRDDKGRIRSLPAPAPESVALSRDTPEDKFLADAQADYVRKAQAQYAVVEAAGKGKRSDRGHEADLESRKRDIREGYLDPKEEGIGAVESATRSKINSAIFNNLAAQDPDYRKAALSEAIGLRRTNTTFNTSLAESDTYKGEFGANETSKKTREAAENSALATKTYADANASAAASILERKAEEDKALVSSEEYQKQIVSATTARKEADAKEASSLAASPEYNAGFANSATQAKVQQAAENAALKTEAYGNANADAAKELLLRRAGEEKAKAGSAAYANAEVELATRLKGTQATISGAKAADTPAGRGYQAAFGADATNAKLQEAAENAALTTEKYTSANAQAAQAILERRAAEEEAKTASTGYVDAEVDVATKLKAQAAAISGAKAADTPVGKAYQTSFASDATNSKLQEAAEKAALNTEEYTSAATEAARRALELSNALQVAKTGSEDFISGEVDAATGLKDEAARLASAKAINSQYIAATAAAAVGMSALKLAETEAIAATNAYADDALTKVSKASTAGKSKQVELANTSDDDLATQGQNQATAARQKIVSTLAQIEASKDDVAGEVQVIAALKARSADLAVLRASDQSLIDSQALLVVANKQERDRVAARVKEYNNAQGGGGPQKPATLTQRLQAHFDPNPDADPLSKRTFGQFAGSHAVNTLGYAVPGLAFGIGIEELSKSVQEASKAQVAFAELGAQFAALGQTSQLSGYTQTIKDIAGNTGLATSEVAELGAAMKGIYGSTGQAEIALKGVTTAAVAMGLTVKEAQEDLTAITQSFSELQNQGGKAITEVSDELLHLQDLTGVDSKQIGGGTAEAGPTANQVGITPKQTASVIAAGVQVSGLSGDTIGQTFAKAIDGITQNYAQIYGVYQNTPSLKKELPTLDKDSPGQAVLQILGDLSKMPAAEQIAIEKSLGVNASALPALTDISKSIGKAQQLSTTNAPAGRTADEAQKKLDTLTGAFDRLRSEVVNLGVSILESGFGTVLVDFAKSLGAVVTQLDNLNRESGGLFGDFIELAAGAVALRVVIAGIKTAAAIPGIIKRTITGTGPTDVAAKALSGAAVGLDGSAASLEGAAVSLEGVAVSLEGAAATIGGKGVASDVASVVGNKGASAAEREGAGALETEAVVATGRKGLLGKFLGAGGGAESSAGGGLAGLGEGTALLGADSALGASVVGIGGLATSLATLPAIIAAITGAVAGAELYKHVLGGQDGGYQKFLDRIFVPSSTPAGLNTKGLGIKVGSNPYVTEGLDGAGDPINNKLTGPVLDKKQLAAQSGIRTKIEQELKAASGSLSAQQNYSVGVDTKEANAGSGAAFENLLQLFGTLGGGKPGTPANPGVRAAIDSRNKTDTANALSKQNAQLDNPSYLKSTNSDRIKQIAANKAAEAATVAQAAELQGTELQDFTSVQSGYEAGDKSYAQLLTATNNAVAGAKAAFAKYGGVPYAEAVEAANAQKTQILDQAVQTQQSEAQALAQPGNLTAAQTITKSQAADVYKLKSPDSKLAAGDAIVADLNTELQDSVNNATSLADALKIEAAGVTATKPELDAYNAAQKAKGLPTVSSLVVKGTASTPASRLAGANETTQAGLATGIAADREDPEAIAKSNRNAAFQKVQDDLKSGYGPKTAQYKTDVAGRTEAQQTYVDSQNAVKESQDQLKETLAQANNDPLAAAQAARDLANQEIADAKGLVERNKAEGDLASANAQYEQALISLIGARAGLAASLAGAGGNSVQAALDTYRGAVAQAAAQKNYDIKKGTDPNKDPTYLGDLNTAAQDQGSYTQSIVDLLSARANLASTLAGAGGDQVGAALAAYQGAIATANAQAQRDKAAGQDPNNDPTYIADLGTVATDEANYAEAKSNLLTAQAATVSAQDTAEGKPVAAAQATYDAAVKVADARAKYDLAHGKNPSNDTEYQADLTNVYTTGASVIDAQISNIESLGQTEVFLGEITTTQYIDRLRAELLKVKGNKVETERIKQDIRQAQDSAGGNLDFDLPSNLLVSPTLYQARRTESHTTNNNPGAVTVNINVNGGDTSAAVRKLLKAVNAPTAPANNALAPRGGGW